MWLKIPPTFNFINVITLGDIILTTFNKVKIGSGTTKYVKYSDLKAGDTAVVGTYVGTALVKAYDPTQPDVPQHTFRDLDGNTVKLNSAGQLNRLLEQVAQGSNVEIVFTGKEKFKNKQGRSLTANQFEVSILEEVG